jgi:hypothetical protein
VAISVLDVRDTHVVVPRVLRPEPALRPLPDRDLGCTAVPEPPRRPPAPVVVAAVGGVVQALGLVAAALTVLASLLQADSRPSGTAIGIGLVVLSTWVVLAATSGAALLDGAGRTLYTWLASVELVIVAGLLVAATCTSAFDRFTPQLPVPAVALLLLAVPAGKLLLAGAASTTRWLAQGPRVRELRPDPARHHRGACVVTLGLIALALTAVAVLVPSPADGGAPTPTVASAH